MINERTLLLEEPEADIRKGTATLKVGMVINRHDNDYTVLWAEFNQPKHEISLFKKLLELEELTASELNEVRPYHFKDIYISRETDKTLKDTKVLELATTAWMPLQFNQAWAEDLDSLVNSIAALEQIEDQSDYSMVRPHWTQVEADKDLKDAVDDWARQQARFITYWKDRSPFEKDETFALLKNEGLIRHPDTIRH